jgi:hypothetical protein
MADPEHGLRGVHSTLHAINPPMAQQSTGPGQSQPKMGLYRMKSQRCGRHTRLRSVVAAPDHIIKVGELLTKPFPTPVH